MFLAAKPSQTSEQLYFVHKDHLGSTLVVTNEKGQVVDKRVYYPFGETKTRKLEVASHSIKRAYTGLISDQDQTGLYYYNARYYNSLLGKFTQPDKQDALLNRYAYVGNNPIALVDPSGHQQARFDDEIVLPAFTNCYETSPKYYWKEPLPNECGMLNAQTLHLFLASVFLSIVGIEFMFVSQLGIISKRSARSPEFQAYIRRVYSNTNFNAKSDLKFIQSLNESIYKETVYNESIRANYEEARESGTDKPGFLDIFTYPIIKRETPYIITSGEGICYDFAAVANFILGQQGIHLEVLGSNQLDHSFLRVYIVMAHLIRKNFPKFFKKYFWDADFELLDPRKYTSHN